MRQVNIYEAKTQLSKLLRAVRAGEEVVIADAGEPIARLSPLAPTNPQRTLGEDTGHAWIADDFDAPLGPETLAAFYGGTLPSVVGRTAKSSRPAKRASPARAR